MQNLCYVYEHWRPDTDLPFYVGKGRGRRAWRFDNQHRNAHHRNVVNKLASLGLCVEVRLVAGGLSDAQAYTLEIERISFWLSQGIRLTNKNAGGKGGIEPTEKSREKMRIAAKKRGIAPEVWMASPYNKAGIKHASQPPEVKAKISKAKTGNIPAESRARIGEAARLRWADPEYRERYAETLRAKALLQQEMAFLEGEAK